MNSVFEKEGVIPKYSEIRTYATSDPPVISKWELGCEIPVFKEQCNVRSDTARRGDVHRHTLRRSRQKSSFAQDLVQVCDGAYRGFVMKKVMKPSSFCFGGSGRMTVRC